METSGGIYIDDTGTPGVKPPSKFLHTRRKSWAAVLIPESEAKNVGEELSSILEDLNKVYGLSELHFTEIYSGKGKYRKEISFEERFGLIDKIVTILKSYKLPILYQTTSPESLKDNKSIYVFPEKCGFLDLSNHEHASLYLLLRRVRNFMSGNPTLFPNPLPVFVDEGIVKAGTVKDIPDISEFFLNGQINFDKSHRIPFLQLADFAAFAIGKSQWLQAKGNLKQNEIKFLDMVSPNNLWVVNLDLVISRRDTNKIANFEEVFEELLIMKRLGSFPKDESQ